ncbi:hypothetical protein ASD67_10700 [Sphingopyxis sp. Root1497]|uniref:SHOCT domain-containing protein n=1 Tax=Sphingopyxis sp. Root1497 TaxID=1736474 RepID=UPI000713E1D4|nr:SHOCT domain-containing protein [Sphingopyxis sp. Root1497]KQZ64875.1 hypothetical protein ASD67_10700 [Sphingopyxis sp. Root1497]
MSKNPQPDEGADEFITRRMAGGKPNKHLEKLDANHMLSGEAVIVWAPSFRIGTTFEGIAVLTSMRLIFFRAGKLGDMLEPIPIDKISSVEAKRGIMFLDATVNTTNDSLKLRFADKRRGDDVLHALQEIIHQPQNNAEMSSTRSVTTDTPMDKIVRLGELRDAGLLTDEEFTAKKAELLSQI